MIDDDFLKRVSDGRNQWAQGTVGEYRAGERERLRGDKEPVVSKPYVMPDDPEEGSAEALAKEAADARDKMLRTLAEMENLRRQTQREISNAKTYGISSFAREVLDIADSLQRALDAVPAEAREAADAGLKALIEGVELTERSLHNTLEKNGVQKFDPLGQKFDPNIQQADVRSSRCIGAFRNGRAGRAGRLYDRGARAPARLGRCLEGRAEELKLSEDRSRHARRGSAETPLAILRRVALAMIRSAEPPPNRSH